MILQLARHNEIWDSYTSLLYYIEAGSLVPGIIVTNYLLVTPFKTFIIKASDLRFAL
jgi:hypothetical protein